MTSVRLSGDRQLDATLAQAATDLGSGLDVPALRAAVAVAAASTRTVEKRTGRLAASHRASVTGGVGRVTAAIRYASYLEYGTRYMRAEPYLTPALYSTPITDYYERHAEHAIRNL